jgi:Glycosyltransferase
MKILCVSQQYWPENWRIVDAAEELVRRGHQVTIVCGLPNDSKGNLISEYRDSKNWVQSHNEVHILRVFDHPRKRGNLNLFLKYVTFAKNATKLIDTLPGDFDVVLSNQLSPIMQVQPAVYYKKKWGTGILMYCYDLWPESLAARKVINRGFTKPIYRHYLHISRLLYNAVDRILVTSPDYLSYLNRVDLVPFERMDYLPQYAEDIFSLKTKPCLSFSTAHNFVFAGNVGMAQDVETLLKAAQLLSKNKDISIHIVGSGSDVGNCKRLSKKNGLFNVFFHGSLPLENMPAAYEAADALLITLSPVSFLNYVLPGKLQSYMEYGKPIICAANGATPKMLAEADCGYSVPSGDYMNLAKMIEQVSALTDDEKCKLGKNAKDYAQVHFNRRAFFDRLEVELKALAK